MTLPFQTLIHTAPASLPVQPLLPGGAAGLGLARGRVHEICGPARRTLAVMALGGPEDLSPVVWILPGWLPERPNPCGLCRFAHPGRFIMARARRPEDLLWSAEEALRSGAVSAVIVELPGPPALTPVRRLHLAAGSVAGTDAPLPLGLILTPGTGGAQGVESRWHMAATPDSGWRLERMRARMEPRAAWSVLPRRDGVVAARLTDAG
ncbi:MAG: ImuA family protein [Gemmobacter sp.]